ncbi:MAG: FecR family protein [Daejeonella sp.]
MTKQEAQQLLDKYANGTCTPEEKALVERWYEHQAMGQKLPGEISDHLASKLEMWDNIREMSGLPEKSKRKLSQRILAAASIIIILSAGIWFYKGRNEHQVVIAEKEEVKPADIDPAENKAVLTLANGSRILLDGSEKGLIANESGIKITKLSDGTVTYEATTAGNNNTNRLTYNKIETPNGGKYQIILPDGSKVWLNAASSLKFPTSFIGKERDVELEGEAYFEVAKNKLLPFRVHTKDMNVFVTGTQFNVMAYNDEEFSATTLVEGSVDIKNSSEKLSLVPGEQAVNRVGTSLRKNEVDVEQFIAWKNGLFQFDNTDIQSVMRQLGRWYDVSVEYRGKIPHTKFGGYISRDSKLSQVIKMLELSGVKFSVQEKKIIVLP